MPHSATNEVVADQLLRAKVRGRGDVRAPSSINSGRLGELAEPVKDVAQVTNPGGEVLGVWVDLVSWFDFGLVGLI